VSKRGLPITLKMRHDAHYVDALASSAGSPIGRMVAIELIDPNPEQPRQVMGDLSELKASISEKGIIEPLIVRQRGSRYQIIAGERRYQAASQVGLRELPVVIREVDDTEVIEVALIENIQRKDLGAFEEAEAMFSLAKRCGYTHEDLAKKLGKSRTSVTEALAIAEMPADIRKLCRLADISSKSLLLQIVRQQTPEKMAALIEQLTREGQGAITREQARKAAAKSAPKLGRPKAFVFQYKPPTKSFNLRLQFKKSDVDRTEVIAALEAIISELRHGK
jgi:ParB family transcriptional regulator, chromosome partitioning protein